MEMQIPVSPPVEARNPSHRTQSRVLQLLVLFIFLGAGFSFLSFYATRSFDLHGVNPRPCIREDISLARWMVGPQDTMHDMDDEQLFWQASMAPQVKKYPLKRVPKVAFMFLTRGPLPLYPLWETFFRDHEGHYSIYIHSLPNYKAEYPQSSVFYRRQVPSQVAGWGQMSMCDAERRLLANALLDLSNDRFVLLSESCIPLHGFNIVYPYLTRSRYSFLGSFDDPGPFGRGRYNRNMAPEVNISQWRKGSQWFEVNRKLAVDIVADAKYYPKFREFCRPACYVDEHYFPTMFTIESPHLVANRSITWVDWSRGGSHPATFGKEDITVEFLKRIVKEEKCLYNDQRTSLCSLFARKFSPRTLEPLLKLAPGVLGYG